jgi:phage terminase small subunit
MAQQLLASLGWLAYCKQYCFYVKFFEKVKDYEYIINISSKLSKSDSNGLYEASCHATAKPKSARANG